MTERRYSTSRPTPTLVQRDPDEPTPCFGNSAPFDVLMDTTVGAEFRYALREAANMCGVCPTQARCFTDNADEGWVHALVSKSGKRAPTKRPSCGKSSGQEAHRRHNEMVCTKCRDAYNAWQRKNRAAKKAAA